MRLEEYFERLAPNDIRIKDTRVGIETVLYDHIHRNRSPEEIAEAYPSLTLEQVYAAITYYLHNKGSMDAYLAAWLEHGERMRAAQANTSTPVMLRLRRLGSEREATRQEAIRAGSP